MKISRDNYEIFFVDYIDGKLSHNDMAELMIFLSQNPDLASELENFELISIEPVKISFDEKNKLKEIPYKAIIINNDNFDEICIKKIEGDLNHSESIEFEKYLLKHPDKEKDYTLYTKTKLTPDCSIEYENKLSLKKYNLSVHNKKWLYASMSVAASVIIILYFYFSPFNNNIKVKPKYIAENKKNNTDIKHSKKANKSKDILLHKDNISIANNEDIKTEKTDNKKEILHARNTKNIKPTIDNNIKSADVHREYYKTDMIETKSIKLLAYKITDSDLPALSLKRVPKIVTQYKQKKEEPKTLAVIAKSQITKMFLNRKSKVDFNYNKLTFWNIADALVNSISKLTDNKMKLENTYNSKGELETFAFSTEKITMSKKVKNK